MATLSFTMSQLAPNIKATHTGSCVVGGAITISPTFCVCSILHCVQLPNGATITDFWLKALTGASDTQIIRMGTSQTPSGIMAKTTLTRTFSLSTQNITAPAAGGGVYAQNWLRAPGAGDLFPVRISLSDDAQPANIWMQLRVAAGCSASAVFTLLLWYTMDGLIGHTNIR